MSNSVTFDETTKNDDVDDTFVSDAFRLQIKLLTNTSDLVTFKRSILVIPEEDKKLALQFPLTDLPFFTYKYIYPLQKLRNMLNYQDRVNIFFNENQFMMFMAKAEPADLSSEEKINEVMETNIMTMLEVLFPTRYPVKNNLHTSYDYLKRTNSYFKPFYFDQYNGYKYTHLNVDGSEKTIKKVVFFNDVINHPKYKELLKETMQFRNWATQKNNRRKFLTKKPKNSSNSNKEEREDNNIALNFENTTLGRFRYPNYKINNSKLQQAIKAENNEDVKKFHEFFFYVNEKYLQNKNKPEDDELEELIKGGICDVEMRNVTNPTKEIYVYIELHNQKIDENNVNDIECEYKGELLGEMVEKMIKGIQPDNRLVFVENATSNTNKNPVLNENKKENNNKKVEGKAEISDDRIIEITKAFMDYARNNLHETKKVIGDKKKEEKRKKYKIVNHLEKLLRGINNLLKSDNLANTDYPTTYVFNEKDIDDVLKFIIKSKLKPIEKKNFSKEFGELLIMWNKEVNNYNSLYPNKLLKTRLNDLRSSIESEIKNERAKIGFELQNPTTKNIEIRGISDYHIQVYQLYNYVAEVMDRYLEDVSKQYKTQDLTGGRKKKRSKKKSTKSKKRYTLKK